MTVEYRVKSVERFIVTRHEDTGGTGSTQQKGPDYPSFEQAYEVATALARDERERLGLEPGDMGVLFPASSVSESRGEISERQLETYRTSGDDAAYRASVPEA
ncbi:hypothetical protein GAO09_19365 [Rhizobiales bacterium RZME27]|uniref:Uncharacterized protein n=1 Tax=Endobacterium cereale TaxID=2663029 RepID=A0A6A8AE59_9HYPH|nr:hypothetical protein [Endobacterium cereale]MQY48198.1 hypothetical protein [Endobacterium cereale]